MAEEALAIGEAATAGGVAADAAGVEELSAGGVAGGGVYQAVGGMQGIYGTPQAPPGPAHGAAVSYRAHTPPHTPNTQACTVYTA